jgi:hypothetical protein
MARKVFYSFHYQDDITRVMTVRNQWVTKGTQTASGVIDKAEFEKIQKIGDDAVKRWIRDQLTGTSATIVLLGANTLSRPFVKYEIVQSIINKNAIIGVRIHSIKDMRTQLASVSENAHVSVGTYRDGSQIYFDSIAHGIYDYVSQDGYNNLEKWVEDAVRAKGY